MKRMHLALGLFLLLFLVNIPLYVYRPLDEKFYLISDLIIIVFSFLAVVFGLYAFKLHGFNSVQGKALLFLTIGTFFWFLGETTWGIYEIVLGVEKPVASVADIFWIIGYPLFFTGLYYVFKVSSVPLNKKRFVALSVVLILVTYYLIGLAIPNLIDEKISLVEKVSTAGYVIGDMILLLAVIVIITYLFGGKFAKSWNIILLAIFMSTIADIYYMNFLDVYETGSLIDILWNLDYILLALGFFYHRETIKNVMSGLKVKE